MIDATETADAHPHVVFIGPDNSGETSAMPGPRLVQYMLIEKIDLKAI